MAYYKVLRRTGVPLVKAKNGRWSLPTNHRPGLWHTVFGSIIACRNGLHLATRQSVGYWCRGYGHPNTNRVFVAEVPKGTDKVCKSKDSGKQTKIVVRTCRLVREVRRGSAEWITLGLPYGPA